MYTDDEVEVSGKESSGTDSDGPLKKKDLGLHIDDDAENTMEDKLQTMRALRRRMEEDKSRIVDMRIMHHKRELSLSPQASCSTSVSPTSRQRRNVGWTMQENIAFPQDDCMVTEVEVQARRGQWEYSSRIKLCKSTSNAPYTI